LRKDVLIFVGVKANLLLSKIIKQKNKRQRGGHTTTPSGKEGWPHGHPNWTKVARRPPPPPFRVIAQQPLYFIIFYKEEVRPHDRKRNMYFLKINMSSVCLFENTKHFSKSLSKNVLTKKNKFTKQFSSMENTIQI
jgi:hypothetical protein